MIKDLIIWEHLPSIFTSSSFNYQQLSWILKKFTSQENEASSLPLLLSCFTQDLSSSLVYTRLLLGYTVDILLSLSSHLPPASITTSWCFHEQLPSSLESFTLTAILYDVQFRCFICSFVTSDGPYQHPSCLTTTQDLTKRQ